MNSINNYLQQWLNELENFSFKDYDNLPDIDLYMDQLITFLEKQLAIFQTSSLDKQITSSMINNYVKNDVVIPPISKKYNRQHLALIQEVCTLKQVLPLSEVKQIINERYNKEENSVSETFNNFKNLVNEKNKEAASLTKSSLENIENNDLTALTDLAVNLAVTAASFINISKRILFLNRIYSENENTEEK